jgi:hypothetical protein
LFSGAIGEDKSPADKVLVFGQAELNSSAIMSERSEQFAGDTNYNTRSRSLLMGNDLTQAGRSLQV